MRINTYGSNDDAAGQASSLAAELPSGGLGSVGYRYRERGLSFVGLDRGVFSRPTREEPRVPDPISDSIARMKHKLPSHDNLCPIVPEARDEL